MFHIIVGVVLGLAITGALQWLIRQGRDPWLNISSGIWFVSEIVMATVFLGLIVAVAVIGTGTAIRMLLGYAAVRAVAFFWNYRTLA